jgi:uncharacterized membrane protein
MIILEYLNRKIKILRVSAVDPFRGVTMLVMLFVNTRYLLYQDSTIFSTACTDATTACWRWWRRQCQRRGVGK